MSELTDRDFLDLKMTVQEGRLAQSNIGVFLIGGLVFSAVMIGVSFAAANANTVGWETLSDTWHSIFYAEAVLFLIHILLILLCFLNNKMIHKLLVIMTVIFSYKMVLDPFVLILMIAKDRGVYDIYLPRVSIIIVNGFLMHFILVIKEFNEIRQGKNPNQIEKKSKFKWVIIFLLVALTGIIVNSGILGANDLIFPIVLFTVLLVAILIGAVEFVMAAYCVIRFPSFLDSASKKVQMKKKKKKRSIRK